MTGIHQVKLANIAWPFLYIKQFGKPWPQAEQYDLNPAEARGESQICPKIRGKP